MIRREAEVHKLNTQLEKADEVLRQREDALQVGRRKFCSENFFYGNRPLGIKIVTLCNQRKQGNNANDPKVGPILNLAIMMLSMCYSLLDSQCSLCVK